MAVVVSGKPEQLAGYIRTLSGFVIDTDSQIGGNYSHVGATLANTVLQAVPQLEWSTKAPGLRT
jgi:hypothetical protein